MTDPQDLGYEHISTSLELEQLGVDVYRSKSLYLPPNARGVFGGQVISQALVSATSCVSDLYALHSLHCYFLAHASSTTPITYRVDRVRDGASYVTRSVRAVQNGQTIFILVCSFHKPEPWQPSHQWTMPDVLPPEQCESEEERIRRLIQNNDNTSSTPSETMRWKEILLHRERNPISIKRAIFQPKDEDDTARYGYWMKARNIPKYEASFQKCILAFMSDVRFIHTPVTVLGLKHGSPEDNGPQYLGMMSSIDHAVWYFDHDFDCGSWLLYEMVCPRIASGRAIVQGKLFTRDGKLVAVTSQEGVLRAKIRGPKDITVEKQPIPKL